MSVVNCVAYAGGVKIGDIPLDDISEVIKVPGNFVWVGLHEPDHDLLRKMQHEFGLHELAVEDALRAHQRPKIEHYGDSVFVVIRTAEVEEKSHELLLGETHFFVGPQYLLSVRHTSRQTHVEVRSRCEANPALLAQGPAFALYALIDFVVDRYFPVIDVLEDDVEDLEEQLFQDNFDRNLTAQIYGLKRRLINVKRNILPLVDVCNQLTRFDQSLIPEITRPYFRDVYDHVVRLNEMTDTLRDLLNAALEANLALVSVAQNEVTKKLAAGGALIAVPTMIAGIYGMNFENMPELKWQYGYFGVVGLIVVICIVLYWQFRKNGWL